MPPIQLKSVAASVYRAPIDMPVTTAFGTMRDRPMVLVRVEDQDGAVGWGEAWCNFPEVGAEHRARLIDSALAPIATKAPFETPSDLFEALTAATAVLAIQSAEPGPFAQSIAAIDIAVSDLAARKANQPLWRYLGGNSPSIPVYASGLNPTAPEKLAAAKAAEGYHAFKLKVGFGTERDHANLRALRETLGPDVDLMVDANQGWTLDQALVAAPSLERFHLKWLEEPIRADSPWSDWLQLKSATSIPLAAGENIAGHPDFRRALDAGVLGFVQPDLAKWGGISACRRVAAEIASSGTVYCPHYLGGGVGLLASAHLLAAVGGPGSLEIDATPNPLRSDLCHPLDVVRNGRVTLSDTPGLGVDPLRAGIDRYRVPH